MADKDMLANREIMLHRIAAELHRLIAADRITTDRFKEILRRRVQFTDDALIDDLLAARPEAGRATLDQLSDILLAFGCEWVFSITPKPIELAQSEDSPQ